MSKTESRMEAREQAISDGIERVLKNPRSAMWRVGYVEGTAEFLRERGKAPFHGGQLCEWLRDVYGLRDPHHHNLWPAMVTSLEAMGWIERTGTTTKPDTRQSHIGAVQVWRSTGRV